MRLDLILLLLSSCFTMHSALFISSGYDHNCALQNNEVKCWGLNNFGRLGYEDTNNRGDAPNEMGDNLLPIDLGSSFIPTQIAAGGWHTCALSTADKVKCWGRNNAGQLGIGDMNDRGDEANEMGDNLLEIDLGSSFIPMQITAGSQHTCALSKTNKVKCFGLNSDGQLGLGDTSSRGFEPNQMGDALLDIDLGSNFEPMQIDAGYSYTCALSRNNEVKCFGNNWYAQLGTEDGNNRGNAPNQMGNNLLEIQLGSNFVPMQIVTGHYHSCALSTDKKVKCWGEHILDKGSYTDIIYIGDEPNEMGDNLPEIDLGSSFIPTRLAIASDHTCALSRNNTVKCWGEEGLGLGDTNVRGDEPNEMGDNLPEIDLGSSFIPDQVACGWGHTCTSSIAGKVKCFGSNSRGELGLGDTNYRGDEPNEMGDNLLEIDLGSTWTPAVTVDPTTTPTAQSTKTPTAMHVPTSVPSRDLTFTPTRVSTSVPPTKISTVSPTTRARTSAAPTLPPTKTSTIPQTTRARTSAAPTVQPSKAIVSTIHSTYQSPKSDNKQRTENTFTFPTLIVIAVVSISAAILVAAMVYCLHIKHHKRTQKDKQIIMEGNNLNKNSNGPRIANVKETAMENEGHMEMAYTVEGPDFRMAYTDEGPDPHDLKNIKSDNHVDKKTLWNKEVQLVNALYSTGGTKNINIRDDEFEVIGDDVTESKVVTEGDGLCNQCVDCGKQDFGQIYDGDGLFYCNKCWMCYGGNANTTTIK